MLHAVTLGGPPISSTPPHNFIDGVVGVGNDNNNNIVAMYSNGNNNTADQVLVAHPSLSLAELGTDASLLALDAVIVRGIQDLNDGRMELASAQLANAEAEKEMLDALAAVQALAELLKR